MPTADEVPARGSDGCGAAPPPQLMGAIDRRVWDARHADPDAIEQEPSGEKGRAWLMRWLPSRAHDKGLFLVFSNGAAQTTTRSGRGTR